MLLFAVSRSDERYKVFALYIVVGRSRDKGTTQRCAPEGARKGAREGTHRAGT